jgi:hypothetical protein
VSFWNRTGSTHLIADVVGWFPEGSGAEPLVPARLMDTRAGTATIDGLQVGGGALGPSGTRVLPVTGRGGVPATGVGAVVLNVTAVGATASDTFVTVWPTGAARPGTSNLNPPKGGAVPNLVFAKVGTGGSVSFWNRTGSTHLIADVVGWFPDGAGASTTIVTKDGTVLGGAGDVVSVTGDPPSQVVLSASAAVPAVGGHLAIAPNAAAPGGLSGLVTALAPAGGGTTAVSLAPADLQDLFLELEIDGATTQPPSSFSPTSLRASSTSGSGGAHAAATGGCGVSGEVNGPELSMGSIGGSFDFSLTDRYARLLVTAAPTIEWTVTSEAAFTCEIPLPTVPIGAIGPALVESGPHISASVSAALPSVQLSASLPISVGMEYDAGVVDNLSSLDLDGSIVAAEAFAEISLQVGIDLDVKLFGVLGVEMTVGPELQAQIQGGCVELTGALVASLSGELGRWGIEWGFEVAEISTGQLLLWSAGCGGKVWQGTIETDRTSYYTGGGSGFIDSTDSSTYELLDSVVSEDGSGDYAASVSGSGTQTSHGYCPVTDTVKLVQIISWGFTDVELEASVYLAYDEVLAEWVFWPVYLSLPGTYENHCTESGTPESTEGPASPLGFRSTSGNNYEPTPLNDTDPDPSRLVGTTTWTLANPPTSHMNDFDEYSYTATYDLTLVDRVP